MLPAASRLRLHSEFGTAVRSGTRARRGSVVVHHLAVPPAVTTTGAARVGFVVSRTVGTSVVRHRVTRRLRHLIRERLGGLPAGSWTVVRALPGAASAPSPELARDLDAALGRAGLSS